MSKLIGFICSFIFIGIYSLNAQIIPLLYDMVPNNPRDKMSEIILDSSLYSDAYLNTSYPSLQIFSPSKNNNLGIGILVIPGGAYQFLAYNEEGTNIAAWFANHGITAFVLKYRLPSNASSNNISIESLQDAQTAIKVIRSQCLRWGIKSNAIGVIGFSAGGHLAAGISTKFNISYITNPKNVSLKPNFQILVYPVISMKDSLTHFGSRNNLLGRNPSQLVIDSFSNENYVDINTPPAYIIHAEDDSLVTVNNSLVFYQALLKNKVSAEIHLYSKGDHGFVLRMKQDDWLLPIQNWIVQLLSQVKCNQ
ncbi:alpha/beta hydrolase [Chitinophaga sp. LS1]|uniref:alpha/beta hydrolase n=1 Tax=Chitinophaga sp. LS1 TaxID=3051176 RepID=UPI002AAA9218|nr:alpha/beta hydrolase [Chitinophaga sp. LS1]WPV67826.1 alpha/beta hydrolase [Chitinophaga sp. LS1]